MQNESHDELAKDSQLSIPQQGDIGAQSIRTLNGFTHHHCPVRQMFDVYKVMLPKYFKRAPTRKLTDITQRHAVEERERCCHLSCHVISDKNPDYLT